MHYITLHYMVLHYITFHCMALHYITLHYIRIHYITWCYITSHFIAWPYITLHYITHIYKYTIIYMFSSDKLCFLVLVRHLASCHLAMWKTCHLQIMFLGNPRVDRPSCSGFGPPMVPFAGRMVEVEVLPMLAEWLVDLNDLWWRITVYSILFRAYYGRLNPLDHWNDLKEICKMPWVFPSKVRGGWI